MSPNSRNRQFVVWVELRGRSYRCLGVVDEDETGLLAELLYGSIDVACDAEVSGKNLVANNIQSYECNDSYQPDQKRVFDRAKTIAIKPKPLDEGFRCHRALSLLRFLCRVRSIWASDITQSLRIRGIL